MTRPRRRRIPRRTRTRWPRTRRWAVVGSALLAFADCGSGDPQPPAPEAAAAAPAQHPSRVVLITLDTTRADALGVYGQPRPTTPNIDRMSGEGVRFANAVTSTPSTLPSHATIMTGKLPYAHGVRSNSGYALPDANQTLAETLSARGFVTAAEVAAAVLSRDTRIGQGFASYRDPQTPGVERKTIAMVNRKDPHPLDASAPAHVLHLDERVAGRISDRGIEFVRAHRGDRFFLWLHYFDPHVFYAPPAEFRQRFPDRPYLGEVSYVDSEIGRFLDTLRGLGLADSTLVVLTADHGEGLKQHGEANHAYFVYDTTMHVPLVMWGPPVIRRGSLVEALVRTADIAPTVLDVLGLPPLDGVQGVSLLPLIRGESTDLRLTGYGESIELLAFGASMIRFVREGSWKYIHKVNPELYDVSTDPGEETNLAQSHPEIVERLRARMAELVAGESAASPAAEIPLDADTRARLQALGYAATTPSELERDSLATLALSGADPAQLVDDIALLTKSLGARKQQKYERAAEQFGQLWKKFGTGSFGLFRAEMLIAAHDYPQAVEQLEQLTAAFPDRIEYEVALGDALLRAGDRAASREHLAAVLTIDECEPKARVLLAYVAFLEKNYPRQHELLRRGAEACAESTDLLNNYAYALATSPDPALRDGARAVEIAKTVGRIDADEQPGHLDTLAAALAEAGDFESARRASGRSIEIESNRQETRTAGGSPQLDEFKRHLARFEAGQPLRDPAAD